MTSAGTLMFFLVLPWTNFGQIFEIIQGLDKVADFALDYYEEINFDGLLGFVITEAQLIQSLQLNLDHRVKSNLETVLLKFEAIRRRIEPLLPKTPPKMPILEKYLLRPQSWIVDEKFKNKALENLGIYHNWTVDVIIKNKYASYKGVPSDHCLMEILDQNCYLSPFCVEMMLAPRVDTGYLLSHRVFYLQIVRLKKCPYNQNKYHDLTNKLCSLMLRETRTNNYLDFPAYDIALEQMVLCGIEGYSEFLNESWRNKVVEWQTQFGCYKNEKETNSKRSSNIIAYGCSDHTTGLGAAALAVNLRFLLQSELN